MIYRPFTSAIPGDEAIRELFLRIESRNSAVLALSLHTSVNTYKITVHLDGDIYREITGTIGADRIIRIDTDYIYLLVALGREELAIDRARVNPVLVQYYSDSDSGNMDRNIEIVTGDGISWGVYGNKLVLSIDQQSQATPESVDNTNGILSLNGITPDADGNVQIVSVSPEITVKVSAPVE